ALGAICFLLTPYLTLGLFSWLRQEIRRLTVSDVIATTVGLIVGGFIAALLAWPISLLPEPYGQVLPFVSAVAICSLAVTAMVTKKPEIFSLVERRAARQAEVPATPVRDKILLDTSAIIDGRVADLARTGFLRDDLVVPGFVLRELQLVADSTDASRRVRGRRGLEVLERIRREGYVRLEVSDVDVTDEPDVDTKLVRAAKALDYLILTGDQNLERIGSLHGVRVLNIHELAHVLRPPLVPGEQMALKIVQPGREYDQGVGFLNDGTMVVVEAGKSLIGQEVEVVVTRTLQTGAGRMAFAHVKSKETA
ncbi:MAG: twitching motility protein PilT, partial [Thermomicrobiaceae bacterium]|nr:twitching motility protein PilT [Thermomicrobiaceae bacterium]